MPRFVGALAVAALAAIALGVGAAVGRDEEDRAPRARGIGVAAPLTVGSGPKSALVLPARGPRRRPTVVFFHGWGLTGPKAYSGWLRHLAARGSTVIVPRYQAGLRTAGSAAFSNAVAGIRRALSHLGQKPRGVVVVGHSLGGVLAVNYASRAAKSGLPRALAVMSVYPGGTLRGSAPVAQDPAAIPPNLLRLLVFASPSDRVVGMNTAEQTHAGAVRVPGPRRRLITIGDARAGDHFAPAVETPQTRRTFWRALDILLKRVGGP